ncbi:geranylgeranyl transferase type-1 subunit beta [Folsomia candida]|uniref:Geranylgeranyl transferase type-1 subunit beta n=1 Tax=Folsomia candida TaxID=158441 RepID=A0A226EYZ8_FOLCA|nr:geranylgeranyl transferase type-1 subunit beta [Folsomia candida]OXA62812.1 Geranylgeranyl transferase type-1 subunit beta [Folsomia candida]
MAEGGVMGGGGSGGDENDGSLWINTRWRMDLLVNHHARFCLRLLHSLPGDCEELETQRMTVLQFAVTSLDILNQIHLIKDELKHRIVAWVYRLQITEDPPDRCGFQGSPTFLMNEHTNIHLPPRVVASHVAMTYAALVTLITLGDDLCHVQRKKILHGLSTLQNSNGSFRAGYGCSESDMRFAYCAVCICYILNDFSTINVPKLIEFIRRSFSYEGCFTSGHAVEGHAGHTFCAVASLVILGKLHETLCEDEINKLVKWCLFRQGETGGFTGRTNKAEDTCYSYWVGGTLALLDSLPFIDCDKNIDFVLGNQNPLSGGIGKVDSEHVDPLHTFLGLAGLSLVKYKGLNLMNPMLTTSNNASEHLSNLHRQWNTSGLN